MLKPPHPIIWTPSSSGKMIGMTYIPEEQVGAIHQHDSYTGNGAYQSLLKVLQLWQKELKIFFM